MKNKVLPLAVVFVAICLIDDFYIRVFFSLFALIWAYFTYTSKSKYIAMSLILLLDVCSLELPIGNINYGVVDTIKNNYFIIRNGLARVIVYCDQEVDYGDEIRLENSISEINSYDNFDSSTFEDYCKGNNIIGSISIINPNIIKEHFSFAKIIYRHNLKYNNQWINALLFSNSLESESDSKYLIFSSGMHISFLAYFLKRIFQLFFYQDKANLFTWITMLILMVILTPTYSFVRVLLLLILEYFIDNKRDALGLSIVLLCLYKPYYVKSVAFLLPMGIKVISLFLQKRNSFVIGYYVIMVQLTFYYQVNLINSLLFNAYRYIFGYLYLLALSCCMLPLSINLNNFTNNLIKLVDELPCFKLNGKYSIFLFAMSLYFIFSICALAKMRYYFFLLLILFVNCHQSIFKPFYTINYLDVGQGDCCVITFPFNSKALLIDTGGNYFKDIAEDIDIPFLNQLAIKSVDVIISHYDLDHSGALENLIKNFDVRNVYDTKQQKIIVNSLEIYNPLYDYQYDDENDNSLLSYFKIDEFYFLSVGDISKNVEYDLLNLYQEMPVDVLKLSHHGSNSASSDLFLANYKPKLAIISAGRNNRYNHPSTQVVERLNNYLIKYLNTQINKGIKLIVGNHFCLYLTSNNKSGILLK